MGDPQGGKGLFSLFHVPGPWRGHGVQVGGSAHEHHLLHKVGKRWFVVLGNIGHKLCHLPYFDGLYVCLIDFDGAGVAGEKFQAALEQGGLAASVRAEEAAEFSPGEGEGDVVKNRFVRIAEIKGVDGEHVILQRPADPCSV